MSVIFLFKLLHCQIYEQGWLVMLPEMQCLVPLNMRWCERQQAVHLWYMPLIRTVPASDGNCTHGGTFSVHCNEYSIFLIIRVFNIFMSKNSDTLIKLHRTCFSTDNLSWPCIWHIKVCFVRNDRNYTTVYYGTENECWLTRAVHC